MKLIFTHRPLNGSIISMINAVTRSKTKCPYDHVALYESGRVYESVVGHGVRCIDFEEWCEGRQGTWCHNYEVNPYEFDMDVFERYEGAPYDKRANWLWLTGQKYKLKRNPTKSIYCSELIGLMKHEPDFYEWTPGRAAEEHKDSNIDLFIIK